MIDDAVVIHENIFRHMEEMAAPREAAGTATREIAMAVVATTMSLLVIFLPVIFMAGRIGRFFSSFGATVAFAIFMSMCVSFTMTPMLCSRFLVLDEGAQGSKSGLVWRAIDGGYGWMLRWSLRHRWVIVLVCGRACWPSRPCCSRSSASISSPATTRANSKSPITMPEGYSLERADETVPEIEARLRELDGVTNLFTHRRHQRPRRPRPGRRHRGQRSTSGW